MLDSAVIHQMTVTDVKKCERDTRSQINSNNKGTTIMKVSDSDTMDKVLKPEEQAKEAGSMREHTDGDAEQQHNAASDGTEKASKKHASDGKKDRKSVV